MKSMTSQDIVFLAGKRTPFGTFGGTLKDLAATDLAVHASKAALSQSGAPAADVGHVVLGNVIQTSPDAIYQARHVALRAGVPVEAPALTVNRLCGSGFEAVVQGALCLMTGQAELALAGGAESMSEAPYLLRGARFGAALGKAPPLEDSLWSSLTDSYAGLPMALTAEKLVEQYAIRQEEVDEYSVLSQRRFAAAQEAGRFQDEIAPMEVPARKGPVRIEALRLRPLRGERGLRPAVPGGGEGAGAPPRSHQRGRRRHRGGPPARRQRRPHRHAPPLRAPAARAPLRPRRGLHRRRARDRRHRGGALGARVAGRGGPGLDVAGMPSFTGCKVFSATLARDREAMSDTINRWLASNAGLEVVDKAVLLSSDRQFHCLTIVFFYRERPGA